MWSCIYSVVVTKNVLTPSRISFCLQVDVRRQNNTEIICQFAMSVKIHEIKDIF